MEEQTFLIDFAGVSERDANLYAEELRNALLDSAEEIDVDTRRPNQLSHVFGSSLVLVLGTPAVVIVAKAIANWLKLHKSASIDIRTSEGSIRATGLTSHEATEIIETALRPQRRRQPPRNDKEHK